MTCHELNDQFVQECFLLVKRLEPKEEKDPSGTVRSWLKTPEKSKS